LEKVENATRRRSNELYTLWKEMRKQIEKSAEEGIKEVDKNWQEQGETEVHAGKHEHVHLFCNVLFNPRLLQFYFSVYILLILLAEDHVVDVPI